MNLYKVYKNTIDECLRRTSEEVGYTHAMSSLQAENNMRSRLGYHSKITVESRGENGVKTITFRAEKVENEKEVESWKESNLRQTN